MYVYFSAESIFEDKNTIYLIYMKFIFEDIALFCYNYYKTKKFFVH